MKAHTKRIRVLRRLALGASVAALAFPVGASAMVSDGMPRPIVMHDAWSQQAQKPFTLAYGFHSESQTPARSASPDHLVLRRTARPESTTLTPTASVAHQAEVATSNDNQTLAVVFSSVAVAIALCSIGYVGFRTTQIQRQQLGSRPQ